MRRFACLVFGGAAALGAAACRSAPQSATAPAPASVRHEFAWGCDPRVGIVRGDLARAQRSARTLLADCSVRNAPAALAAQVADVASAARGVSDARDLRTAAMQTAHLAQACGSCHQATGIPHAMTIVTTPESGVGPLSEQMRRHYWAMDRMWAGLVGPSEANWTAGADALRLGSDYTTLAMRGSTSPQTVSNLAAGVRDLGLRAGTVAQSERPHVYGEFLAGCADCHTAVGGVTF